MPKAANMPRLTRRRAVPVAIGSIAGSGILFLPSAVYARAGNESLVVWAASMMVCLPMLLMFDDMVRDQPDGRSVEGFIRAGLGPAFGRCVPVMYVALVIVGLPSGAFVAGRYVARAFGAPEGVTVGVAASLLLSAIIVNLAGGRASTRIQTIATWSLVIVASVLVLSAARWAGRGPAVLIPDLCNLQPVPAVVTLAFWAFTGFENLTFLSREFADPGRDFLAVSGIALGTYGLFTVLLTTAIAVAVPRSQVDEVVGLLQLAAAVGYGRAVIYLVTAVACLAMLVNGMAWTWGASRLIGDAVHNGTLPNSFAPGGRADRFRRFGLLLGLYSITGAVLAFRPTLVVDGTAAASAIFMILYALSIVSYVRVRGITGRSSVNVLPFGVILWSLGHAHREAAYGVLTLAIVLGGQLVRRTGREDASAGSVP